MESGQSHEELAQALSADFTVFLPDRRGRSRSGPYRDGSVLQQEIEDLGAILEKTGSRFAFGVSSGALICLAAAARQAKIQKVVIFEPPLLGPDELPLELMARFDREIARGDVAAALVTGMKAARLGPPLLDLIPRWLLERMTRSMLAREDAKAAPADVTMRALAPLLHDDFAIVAESAGEAKRFSDIRADVLLLGGSNSPAFLKAALDTLAAAVPNAKRLEMAGLAHSAAGNTRDPMTGRGARPEQVADVLRHFFATPEQP
jgi:pimeloyl-ACP methyl ester carboxylesterase